MISQITKAEDKCRFVLEALDRNSLAGITRDQLKESGQIRIYTVVLAVATVLLAAFTWWLGKSTADLARLESESSNLSLSLKKDLDEIKTEVKTLRQELLQVKESQSKAAPKAAVSTSSAIDTNPLAKKHDARKKKSAAR